MEDSKTRKHSEYDDEPVYYCKRCLSLRIMNAPGMGGDYCYCDRCGGVSVGTAKIDEYERMMDHRIKILNRREYEH